MLQPHEGGASAASNKRRTDIKLVNTTIAVYSGKRVAEALALITDRMKLFEGVKLSQILEAVYDQGKKDGARAVFEAVDAVKSQIPHRHPGQPKKHKK
jgi:hypothetical protein